MCVCVATQLSVWVDVESAASPRPGEGRSSRTSRGNFTVTAYGRGEGAPIMSPLPPPEKAWMCEVA